MEHNNKFLRFNREHHSRKSSVTKGLQDIFNRSMYSCYPRILLILEESLIPRRPEPNELSQDVINLLESSDFDDSMSDISDIY